tara:strand:- start:46 stop:309 length:264 start_codon:yes stop_codon:yes gene_type:complete
MLKEIKYSIFILSIILSIVFSIKFYISDEYKKKTFRVLNSIDQKVDLEKLDLPVFLSDTDNIITYLDKDDNSNKKKFTFWDLLKNEN